MGTHYSPSIVRSGLVMHYDMANTQKSWKGAPATNLLTYSEAAASVYNLSGGSFVSDAVASPTGTLTADRINLTAGAMNSWDVYRQVSVTNGVVYTFSMYVLLGTSTNFCVVINDTQAWNTVARKCFTSADGLSSSTWTRISITFTGPVSSAINIHLGANYESALSASPQSGGYAYMWGTQLETGSYATPYIPTTTAAASRSNTQALVDLTGTNTLTATSLTYVSDNTFSFNGSADYITTSSITDSMLNAGSWTVSSWVKFTTVNKGSDNAIAGHGTTSASNGLHLGERNTQMYFGFYGNDLGGSKVLSAGTWYNITFTYDNGSKLKTIYINGVFDASGGSVGYSGTGSNFSIGRYAWGTNLYGSLPVIQFHTRALSAKEVNQNFNALRGRYGI